MALSRHVGPLYTTSPASWTEPSSSPSVGSGPAHKPCHHPVLARHCRCWSNSAKQTGRSGVTISEPISKPTDQTLEHTALIQTTQGRKVCVTFQAVMTHYFCNLTQSNTQVCCGIYLGTESIFLKTSSPSAIWIYMCIGKSEQDKNNSDRKIKVEMGSTSTSLAIQPTGPPRNWVAVR